jgi:outer membrane protein assembly factor BamB
MHPRGSRSARTPLNQRGTGFILVAALALLAMITACSSGPTATITRATATTSPEPGTVILASTSQDSSGSLTDTIEALSHTTGTSLWKHQFSGVPTTGAIAGGKLYLSFIQTPSTASTPGPMGAIPSSKLIAINAETGVTSWEKSESSGLLAPLGATPDAVLVNVLSSAPSTSPGSAPTGNIEALRAGDGSVRWSVALPTGTSTSTATVADGALYVAVGVESAEGTSPSPPTILALDTSTGHVLWRLPLSSPVGDVAPIVVSNSVLYLSAINSPSPGTVSPPSGFIMAIRAQDGTALWRGTPPDGSIASALVVADATVCYSYQELNSPGGGVAGLHSADGSPAWRIPLAEGGPAPLAAMGGTLYMGGQSKSISGLALALQAYDASTGHPLFSRTISGLPSPYLNFQAPSLFQVAGTAVFVVLSGPISLPTGPGQQPQIASVVLSLRTSDGSTLWKHSTNGTVTLMLVSA